MEFDQIQRAAVAAGLTTRGGFHPAPDDAVPPMPDGRPAATLVLLGNAGPGMWRKFKPFAAARNSNRPLDEWSERVITELGELLGAHPLFPFSRAPFPPFQRWAQRAEPVWPSRIGMLIHFEYGVWHAYRGALAFADRIQLPPAESAQSPCETCAGEPCLSACPVDAFGIGRYDVPACVAHLASPAGSDCMQRGCAARRACPVGREFRYLPAQAEFHMRWFLRAHQRRPRGPSRT